MGKEFDIDLSGIKQGIMDELSEVVADAYAQGAKEGAKKGTKKIEKELEETKVKLNTVVAEVEDIAMVIDDEQAQNKLKSVAQKAVGKKPVKIKANVEVEPEIKLSKSFSAVNKGRTKRADRLAEQIERAYKTNYESNTAGSAQRFIEYFSAAKEKEKIIGNADSFSIENQFLTEDSKKAFAEMQKFYDELIADNEKLRKVAELAAEEMRKQLQLLDGVSIPSTQPSHQSGVLSGDENSEKAKEAELDLYHMAEKRKVTYDEIVDKIKQIISLEDKIKTLDESKSNDGKFYNELHDEYVDWTKQEETVSAISERLKEIYSKYNGKISLISEEDIKEAAYLMDILTGADEHPLLNKSQKTFFDNKKFKNGDLFNFIDSDYVITEGLQDARDEVAELTNWFMKLEGVDISNKLRKQISGLTGEMMFGSRTAEEYAEDLLKVFDITCSTPVNQTEVLSGSNIDAEIDKLEEKKHLLESIKDMLTVHEDFHGNDADFASNLPSEEEIRKADAMLKEAFGDNPIFDVDKLISDRNDWLNEVKYSLDEYQNLLKSNNQEDLDEYNRQGLSRISGAESFFGFEDNSHSIAGVIAQEREKIDIEIGKLYDSLDEADVKIDEKIKDVVDTPSPQVNQTPLSSSTSDSSKAGEEARETAQEIENADERIEDANEEAEQSEEELAQETAESRDKAARAAREQADEVEKANARIVESNKKAAQSEQNPLNTSSSITGLENEAEAMREVVDSAKKAAEAKGEFANSNKKVKTSADASTPSIENEAEAFTVVPMTEEWNKAVKAAEDYMSILGEVYNVTRKIRTEKDGNRLISYQLTGETGNSITIGENGDLVSSTEKISDALNKSREVQKVLSDWDEAIQINDELDKAQQYSEDYAIAIQQAIENEKRENEYIKERNRLLAEGKKQEEDYYKQKAKEAQQYTSWYDSAMGKKAVQDREASAKKQEAEFNNATKQNERAATAYDKLYKEAKDYYELLGKQKSGQKLTADENRELERLTKEFYEASEGVGKYAKALDELGSIESKNKYDKAKAGFLKDSAQSYLDYLKVDIDKSADKFVLGTANKRALEFVEEYKAKVKELGTAIESLKTLQGKGVDIVNSKELGEVSTLLAQVEKLEVELRRMKNNKEFQAADKTEAYDSIANISQTLEKNTAMPRAMKEMFRALQQEYQIVIDTGKSQKELEEVHAKVAKLNAKLQASGKTGRSFFDLIGTKAHHLAAQFFAMYVSFQDLLQIMRRGFEVIKEYDSALTEMNKVSDESLATLKEFQKESFALADAIASTASSIQTSTADFMKLGYALEEASQLAESANIYANVGDMEIDEATEHMVSSVKAWSSEFANDVEAAKAIVDRYNEIGNNYAITSADIGEAMERSAAALKAGGNTLNESLGLIVAGNVIQQDAETTANALKVMSLRLRGSKADLEEMGEETDGLVTSTSKLREQLLALTGVDIMLDDDTFKSSAQMIKEIGAEWDKLTDSSQAATLELMAGKTRASVVAGLLENYELIDDVIESAESATNSALEENARYAESIEGHLSQLSNAWDSLWVNENNREVITFFLDLAKGILEAVDSIGVLNTALLGIGGFLGAKSALSGGGRAKCCPSREYATGEFSSDVYELCVA